MAGSKRERELHRQKLARQHQEAARAAETRRKRLRIGGIALGVLLVVGVVAGVAIAGGDDDKAPAPSTSVADRPTPAPSPVNSAATSKVKCAPVNDKQPDGKQYSADEAAKVNLLPDAVYDETITTNCGEIKFAVDTNNAPETAKAFMFLSDRNYFDNTLCHRLTTANIYVLQCGDPLANGKGGPGFQIAEENLPEAGADGQAIYPRGTVAMANAGAGTTGSQFFLVYKDSPLPPEYTRLGTVTSGMEIIDKVAAAGTKGPQGDGPPTQPLQITKMRSSVTYDAFGGQQ